MATRYLAMLATLLTLPAPAAAEDAQLAALPLAVRVYESAPLPRATRDAALSIAAAALAAADIDVHWRHCPPGNCRETLAHDELLIRVVPRGLPAGTARLMTLGDAMIDRSTGAGRLASIYLDRVVRLAQAAGVDVARVLGYAVAHELGHILLADTGHSRDGLMRAVWSDEQLRHARPADWSFTRKELATIRARRVTARTGIDK